MSTKILQPKRSVAVSPRRLRDFMVEHGRDVESVVFVPPALPVLPSVSDIQRVGTSPGHFRVSLKFPVLM